MLFADEVYQTNVYEPATRPFHSFKKIVAQYVIFPSLKDVFLPLYIFLLFLAGPERTWSLCRSTPFQRA